LSCSTVALTASGMPFRQLSALEWIELESSIATSTHLLSFMTHDRTTNAKIK
jgi:hypothetical protein